MWRHAPWLGALVALGCEVPPTQLVVVVRTDMAVTDELDAFSVAVDGPDARSVTVEGPGQGTYGAPIALRSSTDLPATFGVRPHGGDARRKVTVRATAMHGGETLFETRAVTSFVEDEQLRLELFLARRCVAEQCDPDETCSLDGCIDPDVPTGDLPDWNGDVPLLDASVPDGGGAGAGAFPKLIAWTDDAAALLFLGDAMATSDGKVWFTGTVLGAAFLAGDPDGAQAVDVTTPRVWLSCLTIRGTPCGLHLLGDDAGDALGGPATIDDQDRLLLTGTFRGAPDLGVGAPDVAELIGATFVVRWKPDDEPAEVGFLRAAGPVTPRAITAFESDDFVLGALVETGDLTIEDFAKGRIDGSPEPGGHFLAFDSEMHVVDDDVMANDVVEVGVDRSSFQAASASTSVARVFSTTSSDLIGRMFDPAAGWPLFVSDSDCSAIATASSEDGAILACSVETRFDGLGDPRDAPGALWLAFFSDDDPSVLRGEAVLGEEEGIEQVFDGAGGGQGTAVWGGQLNGTSGLGGIVLDDPPGPAALVFATSVVRGVPELDWSLAFPSTAGDDVKAVAIAADGSVLVAGSFGGTLTIDGTTIGDDDNVRQVWAHRIVP